MKKIKNKGLDFLGTIVMLLNDIGDWIDKNDREIQKFILNVCFIASTLLIIFLGEDNIFKFVGWFFLYLIYIAFDSILNYIDRKQFPQLKRRLTKKDSSGAIKIKGEFIEQAIIYLYEIEEYLGK